MQVFENFITAVKSRKVEDQYADCEETHLSSALCHTANISYRLGKKATPDELRATAERHRSPLVWRAVEDFLSGRRFPLQALTHCP